MTVNIGLVTSDALVLGCDSVASTTEYFIDPDRIKWERDSDGKIVRDADGKFSFKFDYGDFRPIVTNAWGGVTKMFQIYPDPSPVVAVTAGLAKLQDRTVASHAAEFLALSKDGTKAAAGGEKKARPRKVRVEAICNEFLRFMRRRYLDHYKDSTLPDEFRDGPEFLVGGIGRDDAFPSLYRLSVQHNKVVCDFSNGAAGVGWNGQATAVERFIKGFDNQVKAHVERRVREALQAHAGKTQIYVMELVNGILDRLKRKLPKDIEIQVPKIGPIQVDWNQFAVPIEYANLPLQEAVHFVSTLVMAQASRMRFAAGVATVGGRTHIGIVTKAKGFEILNEPPLVHRFTGLSDDA